MSGFIAKKIREYRAKYNWGAEVRFYSRYSFGGAYPLDHALKTNWGPEYNEKRPHGSLGGMTPMDFLRKRLKEIKNQNLQELIANYELKRAA